MWKWTRRIALVVLVLFIGGGVAIYLAMDGILRRQIEEQSSKSLNLGTKLEAASFQPFKGNLSLTNFTVDNPAGFSSDKLLDLGGLSVKVDYGQLRSNPTRIDTINIDRPRMLLEHKDGRFNVKAVVDQFYGEPTGPTPPQPQPQPQPQPSPDSADSFRLIIGKIAVTSPVVVLRPNLPGLTADQIEIPLESFELNNIGNDGSATNGAAFKQVVTQLVTTMAAKARASDIARKILPPELAAALDGDLTRIAGKLVPGDAGKVVSQLVQGNVLKDPNLLKQNALGVAGQQLRGIGGPTTQPLGVLGNFAADAIENQKKKDDKKADRKDDRKKDKESDRKPVSPLPLPPPPPG